MESSFPIIIGSKFKIGCDYVIIHDLQSFDNSIEHFHKLPLLWRSVNRIGPVVMEQVRKNGQRFSIKDSVQYEHAYIIITSLLKRQKSFYDG